MSLRRICAWCGAALDPPGQPAGEDAPITHGICSACKAQMLGERSHSLVDFLERLDGPVILFDSETLAQEANSRACALLGKGPAQVHGHRGGEIIDCVYSELPGGCGASEHCRTGCVIRRSVMHTLTTGQPVVRASSEQEVKTPEGARVRRFLITTERAGAIVLLRIDAVE